MLFGGGGIEPVETPIHKQFNRRLNLFESKTIKLWDEYQHKGILPTSKEFKTELVNHIEDKHEKAPSLLLFIKQVNEERELMNKPNGSIKVYKNCLKYLGATFQKRKKYRKRYDSNN